jgi:hypothetical protein
VRETLHKSGIYAKLFPLPAQEVQSRNEEASERPEKTMDKASKAVVFAPKSQVWNPHALGNNNSNINLIIGSGGPATPSFPRTKALGSR